MKKIIFLFLSLFIVRNVSAGEIDITAKHAILYNMTTDEILYEKDANTKTPIASLTKMMSIIIAIENIDDLNNTITITKNDIPKNLQFSVAGFKVNDKVTYMDLLYGAMLPSGADAINALVNNTFKDEFVNKMNEKAQELEMNNTKFANAVGRDNENNYSTASDLLKLLKYAISNETFKEVFTSIYYKTSNGLELKSTLSVYGKNFDISFIDGAKSGYTTKASLCLASKASFLDNEFLLITISSNNKKNYNAVLDSLNIYNYFKDNYSYKKVLNKNDTIASINVNDKDTYKIYPSKDIYKFLKNNDSITYMYDGIRQIDSNMYKNDYLGKIKVLNNNELIYEEEIFLKKNIIIDTEEVIKENKDIILYVSGIILLIILILFLKRKRS